MFVFICRQKVNFTLHGFLNINCQHFGPKVENQNLSKYEIGGEISTAMLAFILGYFQEKLMTKFFKKSKKKKIKIGGQFGPFLLKFGQKCFLVEKAALPVFKYSNIPINYHHVKNQKKIIELFLRKMLN